MANSMAMMRELLVMSEDDLFNSADALRKSVFGSLIGLCAIINIRSGNCTMDCKFCAQSRHNLGASANYELLPDAQLEERIRILASWPVAHIGIVASGAALTGKEFIRLCRFVDTLPDTLRDRICVSLGRLSAECMRDLRTCGVRHYHHNLETSQKFYPNICSTQTWISRYETLERARKEGFELCSGVLFGMGESWDDRLAVACSLSALGIKNIPINFINPRPGTPFANISPLTPSHALRSVGILRHILPQATLRICGGRGFCLGNRQKDVFKAGANALMTGDYLTTTGSGVDDDLAMLHELGLQVAV